MGASLKTLGIERLSVEDRISLVEEIWDSIAEDTLSRKINALNWIVD